MIDVANDDNVEGGSDEEDCEDDEAGEDDDDDEDEDEDEEEEDEEKEQEEEQEEVDRKTKKQKQDLMPVVVCGESVANPMSTEKPGAECELHRILKNALDLVRQALAAIRGRLH
jgi:TATA-binding protein-associated factor Taf7